MYSCVDLDNFLQVFPTHAKIVSLGLGLCFIPQIACSHLGLRELKQCSSKSAAEGTAFQNL